MQLFVPEVLTNPISLPPLTVISMMDQSQFMRVAILGIALTVNRCLALSPRRATKVARLNQAINRDLIKRESVSIVGNDELANSPHTGTLMPNQP